MQENCKHLADEEMLSHQLFARERLCQTIKLLNSTYNKIANSFDLLGHCNASKYAYYHDKEGATGGGGLRRPSAQCAHCKVEIPPGC